jgi:predicted AlkP superfamily pyrophosphatase or phosphodiesterase
VKVVKKPVTGPNASGVKTVSNGTHTFQPTVLIISLDGFRPNYIDVGVTPNLHRLRETGVAPEYMKPSFPSVTFPNVPPLTNLLIVALYFGYWIVS